MKESTRAAQVGIYANQTILLATVPYWVAGVVSTTRYLCNGSYSSELATDGEEHEADHAKHSDDLPMNDSSDRKIGKNSDRKHNNDRCSRERN